jgi:uncharacterized protein YecE (DUF72 family)
LPISGAKVPQGITHEKVLVDCDDDLNHFLDIMSVLGDKLGPLLFQFAFANNHYAGNGPATVKLFLELWRKKP